MAVNPIHITRVSHNLRTQSILQTLRQNTVMVFNQQARLASGSQLIAPSDDPVLASQAVRFTEVLERQDQVLTNIRHGNNFLAATESAINEVSELLIQAHSIASENVSSLVDPAERESAAQLISAIIDQLVTVGNRQFQGRYLFGGLHTDQSPFSRAGGGVLYRGDTGDLAVQDEDYNNLAVNLSGSDLFGALSAQIEGLVNLSPVLNSADRLEDLTGATAKGVRLGQFVVTEDGGAGSFTVDLTKADTIGDVVDMINTAAAEAGATLIASLGDDGLVITPGSNAVSISDTATGTVASDLGIVTAESTTTVITGQDLGLLLSPTTLLSDLLAGAGLDLSEGFAITNGGETATIDLTGAETVQDLLNRINNAGVFVLAQINAQRNGITIVNRVSGTALSVGENGGEMAVTLGIHTLAEYTPLSELNNGKGVERIEGEDDLKIVAKDGSTVVVNLDSAETVGDILDLINAAANDVGVSIEAQLAETGNGIRIVDSTGGTDLMRVERVNFSYAIDDLGLDKQQTDAEQTDLIGDDPNPVRAQGVLTALLDLKGALRNGVEQDITEAAEAVNRFMDETNRARGVIGARAQAMQRRLELTEDAVIATEGFLSEVKDLDYTEAITKFQQAQTALQANLLSSNQLLSISLLDFLR